MSVQDSIAEAVRHFGEATYTHAKHRQNFVQSEQLADAAYEARNDLLSRISVLLSVLEAARELGDLEKHPQLMASIATVDRLEESFEQRGYAARGAGRSALEL